MKAETVVKILTVLCIAAWLKCSNTCVENMKKFRLGVDVCVCPEYVVPGCVMLKVCLVGKVGEMGRCGGAIIVIEYVEGKEKMICPNCCLLSSEITGFLDVCHEYP